MTLTPLTGFAYIDSENTDLTVGSLDDPAAMQSTSHFAVELRIAGWPTDDGLPGQRLDPHDRLTTRWRNAYGDAVVSGDRAIGRSGVAAAQQDSTPPFRAEPVEAVSEGREGT